MLHPSQINKKMAVNVEFKDIKTIMLYTSNEFMLPNIEQESLSFSKLTTISRFLRFSRIRAPIPAIVFIAYVYVAMLFFVMELVVFHL